MSALFLELLNLSIMAGWLVLAVLIVRACLKKTPKFIRCILWGMVGLRLIFPFSIESIFSLIPSGKVIDTGIVYERTPAINSGIPVIDNVTNNIMAESFTPKVSDSVNPLQVITYVASNLWILGLVAMLIYCIISYILVKRKVFDAIKLYDNIYCCEGVTTPFVLGVFKPRIYIPYQMDESAREYVAAHERAHIKRGDHITKLVGFCVLSVYWFNPLIWIAYILLCKDIELACDEKVLKNIGETEKKNYSKVLLEYSVSPKMIAACPLAFGEVAVKQRIRNALNYKKTSFWIILLGVLVCIVVAVCFLTSPKEKKDEETWTDETVVPDTVMPADTVVSDTESMVNNNKDGQNKQDMNKNVSTAGGDNSRNWFVMVDDKLYRCTWRSSEETAKCGVMDGEIETSVEKNEIPTQNNQSNFGTGYGWQRTRYNEIEVYMSYMGVKQWIRFVEEGTALGDTEFDEKTVLVEADNIFSITMVNGNTGEEIKTSRLMSDNTMKDLLESYLALEFETLEPKSEPEVRVGWQYSMRLYDADGNLLQTVTPYSDIIKIDSNIYDTSMNNTSGALLYYMNMKFHPVEAIEGLYAVLDEVRSDGVTFGFFNSTDKEVEYGEWFTLWVEEEGVWKEVEPVMDEWAFYDVANIIPPYGNVGWSINWGETYGTLKEGEKYKIEMQFFIQDESSEYIETVYAYEFVL